MESPRKLHLAEVVNSEVVYNGGDFGIMVILEWKVLRGPLKGHLIKQRLPIEHENFATQTIARTRLREIAGPMEGTINCSDELHGRKCYITLSVESVVGIKQKPKRKPKKSAVRTNKRK